MFLQTRVELDIVACRKLQPGLSAITRGIFPARQCGSTVSSTNRLICHYDGLGEVCRHEHIPAPSISSPSGQTERVDEGTSVEAFGKSKNREVETTRVEKEETQAREVLNEYW